jgi:hypothetical protein
MKKFLLSLACVLGLASSALADDAPFLTISTGTTNQQSKISTYTATWKLGESGSANTWTVANFNNNSSGWTNIRCGRKSNASTATIATDFQVFAKIDKVTVNMSLSIENKANLTSLTLLVSKNADFTDATTYSASDFQVTTTSDVPITITDPQDGCYYKLVFECSLAATANGFCWVNSISYYGEAGDAPAVSKPTISLGYDNKVTLAVAEEGASIYYTLDGSEPTASSTLYTEPFAITEKTTVKAVGALDGELGAVVTEELTPYANYATIAEVLDATPSATFVLDGPLTVVYQTGAYTYVQDADENPILIYSYADAGIVPQSLENGDQLGKFIGTYKEQSKLPELLPAVAIAKLDSKVDAVEPEELGFDEIGTDNLNKYIKLSGVSVTAISAKNITITDGGEGDDAQTLTAYNQFGIDDPKLGEGYTVYGFVSIYSKTLQIYPTLFDSSEAKTKCDAPQFSLTEGTVNENSTLEITSATDGASIFYTTDGTEPTIESTEYTGPITISETTTVKAIAVKEGSYDSDIASATFTVVPGVYSYAYNFVKPTTLTFVGSSDDLTDAETVATTAYGLDGKTVTDGDTEITFAKGDLSTTVRIYNSQTVADLRLYKGDTFTVKVTKESTVISAVEFTTATSFTDSSLSVSKGSITLGEGDKPTTAAWTKVVEDGDDIDTTYVTFTAGATTRINTIKVVIASPTTGVETIAVDNADAPVEYYNLQGVRVANPTPGLYITRQGTKVSKTLVK